VGNGFRLVYRATEELEPNPDAGAIEGGIHALEALNRDWPRFSLRHRGKTANPAASGTSTKCHDIRGERVNMFERSRKLFLLRKDACANNTTNGSRHDAVCIEKMANLGVVTVGMRFGKAEVHRRIARPTRKNDLFFEREIATTELRAMQCWTDSCHECLPSLPAGLMTRRTIRTVTPISAHGPRPTGYGVVLKIPAPAAGMRKEVHAGPPPDANQVDDGPELDGGR
jgi:hypothetical protein